MAAVGTSTGFGVKLHSFSSNPSSFLGKNLSFKTLSESAAHKKFSASKSKNLVVVAAGGEIFNFVHDLFLGVGVGLPCTVMEYGDIIYRSTLPKSHGISPTVPGVILALGTISYLWATPGVAPGFFDMFVLTFVERLFRPTNKRMTLCWGRSWVDKLSEWFIGGRCCRRIRPPKSKNAAKKGSEYWLMWKFEGESTLAVLFQSKEFPYSILGVHA